MKKRLSVVMAVMALTAAGAGPAAAFVNNTGAGTSKFLDLGAGARALGMGEAYSPVAEGPDAIYWNPAGLAQIERPEFSYTHTEFMRFFHHEYAAYAHPVEALKGTLAVSFTHYWQDPLPAVDNVNKELGTFSPNGQVYTVAYARSFRRESAAQEKVKDYFGDKWNVPGMIRPLGMDEPEPWTGSFMFGLAFKILQETIYTAQATAFAVDGGAIYRPAALQKMSFSFAFRNAGSRTEFLSESEALPSSIEVGAAYDARWGLARALPAVVLVVPYYGPPHIKVGAEYSRPITKNAAGILRAGYKTQTAAFEALSGTTFGLGVRYRRVSVDFAFQPLDEFGEVYRMTLGYGW